MTEKQYIDCRKFFNDNPCCQNIIILLYVTQQQKIKAKLPTWFSHAKKTMFV